MIPYKSLPPDAVKALPEANSRVFLYKALQLRYNLRIVFDNWLIALRASRYLERFTSLTDAYTMFFNHVLCKLALLLRRYSFFSTASFKA